MARIGNAVRHPAIDHLVANLVAAGTDRRTNARQNRTRPAAIAHLHDLNRPFGDQVYRPAPAGMHQPDNVLYRVVEQQGNTVTNDYAQGKPRYSRNKAVGVWQAVEPGRLSAAPVTLDHRCNPRAVHLLAERQGREVQA